MSDFWEVRIQDVAEVLVSNVDKKSYEGQQAVVLCNYMDIYSNDYISSDLNFMESTASEAEIKKFSLRKGDVVITKDSESPFDIGIPSVVTEDIDDLVCGYHLAIIRPNLDKVDPLFLAKQLSSEKSTRYFARVAAGSTRFGLSIGAIHALPIQITSLEVQKKIGEIGLTIDSQIDATQALIDKYTSIKQGMMADLFSRGIDPETKALRPTFEEAPELYHKTPLGMLPKGWSVAKLAKLATKITDGDHHTPKRSSEGRYLLSARNIHDGYLDFSKVDYVPEFEYQRMIKRCFPEAGDIFISCSGSIGRVCEVPENFSCALVRSVALVKLDNNLVQSSYICWWLRTEKMQKAMINSALQAAQPNLFQGAIEQLDAVLCDFEEQFLISERLNAIENMMLLNKRELQKLEVQKAGLMQDLLTGKVPVPA